MSVPDPGAQLLPPTSLIVPSRGRPELLLATVQSILQGEQVPSELIIVDHSDAPQAALAALSTERDCQIRYQWSQARGVSRGRNEGIRLAKHKILVFADDDILATPAWFGTLVSALVQNGPMTIVIGQIRPAQGESPDQFVPSAKTDQVGIVYTGRLEKDVLYTANTAMYQSAIEHVGVFDERLGPGTGFNGSEDSDLGFRLLEANYRIVYVPEALVYHRAWRFGYDYLPMRWNYGVGRGAYFAKYFGLSGGHMRWRMLRDIGRHLLAGLYYLYSDRRRALGDAVLVAGILYGAVAWPLVRWRHALHQPATNTRPAGHGPSS